MTAPGGDGGDQDAVVELLLRRAAANLRGLSSMEVRRLDDHRVAYELVLALGDPAGRRFGLDRGEQDIAWRWPAPLGDFELGFVGRLVPLPAWPPPWPVWVGLAPDRPPRAGDQALLLLLQMARLPGAVPYAQLRYDEGRGGCVATLVDGYLDGVTDAQRRRAALGFKLLQRHPGRIGSGRRRLEDELWQRWRDDVKRALDLKRRSPSLSFKVIAEAHLGISYGTLRKYLTRYRRLTPR
jgi:hypothetical protein